MGIVRKILTILSKTVVCLIVTALMAVAATSFSPVYRFRPSAPFCGPDIYNPYSQLDSNNSWKRANFHTHTKVEGIFTECDHTPQETYDAYEKLGLIIGESVEDDLANEIFSKFCMGK